MCIKLFEYFAFALNKNDYGYLMKIYYEPLNYISILHSMYSIIALYNNCSK